MATGDLSAMESHKLPVTGMGLVPRHMGGDAHFSGMTQAPGATA